MYVILDTNFVRSLTLDGLMIPSFKFFHMLLVDGIVGESMKMVIERISELKRLATLSPHENESVRRVERHGNVGEWER